MQGWSERTEFHGLLELASPPLPQGVSRQSGCVKVIGRAQHAEGNQNKGGVDPAPREGVGQGLRLAGTKIAAKQDDRVRRGGG